MQTVEIGRSAIPPATGLLQGCSPLYAEIMNASTAPTPVQSTLSELRSAGQSTYSRHAGCPRGSIWLTGPFWIADTCRELPACMCRNWRHAYFQSSCAGWHVHDCGHKSNSKASDTKPKKLWPQLYTIQPVPEESSRKRQDPFA